jgi:hypothetical protein
MRIVKKNHSHKLSAMADNFGCRFLCYHFPSQLLVFKNSEETVLLPSWHISPQLIFVIFNTVLVVEYAIF